MVSFFDRVRAAQNDWLERRGGDVLAPAVVIHVSQGIDLLREFEPMRPDTINSMKVFVCEHVWGPCVVDSRGMLALKMVGARPI